MWEFRDESVFKELFGTLIQSRRLTQKELGNKKTQFFLNISNELETSTDYMN